MKLITNLRSFSESYWLPFGFFVMLAGMYIFPGRNEYKTGVYLSFVLPSLLLMTTSGLQSLKDFVCGPVLWMILVYVYFALSALWADDDGFIHYSKYALLTIVSAYGCCWLYARNVVLFHRVATAALMAVGLLSLFWIVDYYWLLDQSFGRRFMRGAVDSLGIYDEEKYATFYNPLLLSHVLVLFIAYGVQRFFILREQPLWCRSLIIVLLLPLICLLILAQTRSAWFATCMVVAFNLIWNMRVRGLLLILILGLLISSGMYAFSDLVLKRGLSLRPEIWAAVWESFWDHPVFGAGIGSHTIFVIKDGARTFYDAHNIWFAVAFYGGFVGLVLWCALIFCWCRKAFQIHDSSGWFITWMLVLVVGGLADGGGLLARPNEHWFNIVLPLIFMLAFLNSQRPGFIAHAVSGEGARVSKL